jgi:hypothetical protein
VVDALAAGLYKEVEAAVVGASQAHNIQQAVASCCGQKRKQADDWPKDEAPCPVKWPLSEQLCWANMSGYHKAHCEEARHNNYNYNYTLFLPRGKVRVQTSCSKGL